MGGVRNYYSNLPLFKLIRVNNLIRNQEVPRGTPNHSKRALRIIIIFKNRGSR